MMISTHALYSSPPLGRPGRQLSALDVLAHRAGYHSDFTAGKWRAPVLFTLCLIEVFIGSMILGVYLPFIEDVRVGSSPILLLRDVVNAPIFAQANYLELVEGTGLNPLLQNY